MIGRSDYPHQFSDGVQAKFSDDGALVEVAVATNTHTDIRLKTDGRGRMHLRIFWTDEKGVRQLQKVLIGEGAYL